VLATCCDGQALQCGAVQLSPRLLIRNCSHGSFVRNALPRSSFGTGLGVLCPVSFSPGRGDVSEKCYRGRYFLPPETVRLFDNLENENRRAWRARRLVGNSLPGCPEFQRRRPWKPG